MELVACFLSDIKAFNWYTDRGSTKDSTDIFILFEEINSNNNKISGYRSGFYYNTVSYSRGKSDVIPDSKLSSHFKSNIVTV